MKQGDFGMGKSEAPVKCVQFRALNGPLQLSQARAQLSPGVTRSMEDLWRKQWAN